MGKIRTFITHFLFSEEIPLDVRAVNVVSFVGTAWIFCILLLRLAEFFFMRDLQPIILILVAVFLVAFVVVHIVFHLTNASASVRAITTLVIVDIGWPLSFFVTGGIESGFAAAFVVSLATTFFVVRGRSLVMFLGLHCALIVTVYVLGFVFQDLVTQYSTSHVLLDTIVAVIASGFAVGFVDLFQNRLYTQEHQKVARESQAKADFLSNMSHEIRTPMNAIIGMSTIARNASSAERKDDALNKIDSASRHLLGVINDILDMSKLDAQRLTLSPTDFNLADMLRKVLTINELSIKNKNLNCEVDTDNRIPPHLFGDDLRLSQVVTNLLSNAIKFTPAGGHITLRTQLVSGDDTTSVIRVSVSDTGIGISDMQREQLFTPFHQAESGTSRKYGGTGLGLAISKSIIELMGGHIGVESELGHGATFFFEVSLLNGTKPDKESVGIGGSRETLTSLGDLSGQEIMLAEDIEVNREIVAAFLEDTGLGITMAKNGRQALELFEADPKRYKLILMDMQMPEMDGLEATRRIRALKVPEARTVPIIAMTANVFREDVERCLASGMNGHLGKPITIDRLKAILKEYLVPAQGTS
ncbi:MAG: response regulator [Coriobacteriales bacterium]|jgi:signal transduction histidine kinase/ActR/RegA family two-component response regulator|nr:response regulator [Coriobacteriales bacterium]